MDKNVPIWDGKASSLEAFAEEIELWSAGVEDRQLPLLGRRVARAHPINSKMRSIAMALGLTALRSNTGPEQIITAFRTSLSDKAEAELCTHVAG